MFKITYHNLLNMKRRAISMILIISYLHLCPSINAKPLTPEEYSLNELSEVKEFKRSSGDQCDYVIVNRTIPKGRGFNFNMSIGVTVEVAFVLDYTISTKFKSNNNKIHKYVSLLIDILNTRFYHIKDVKIRFALAGYHTIQSQSAQPFIEQCPIAKLGKRDANKMVELFGAWVKQNLNTLPPHDVMTLLTSAPLSAWGIAKLGQACWPADQATNTSQSSHNVNIIQDDGDFTGKDTLTHETAHSLGARHDGEDGNTCRNDGGYLLSMMGAGPGTEGIDPTTFSPCNIYDMKQFFQISQSSCMDSMDSIAAKKELLQNQRKPHDMLNMTKFCIEKGGYYKGSVARTDNPDEQCEMLNCQILPDMDTNSYRPVRTAYGVPMDGSFPCGNEGVCQNKHCVGSKPMNLDTVCKEKTLNAGSKLYHDGDQCKVLKCQVINDGVLRFYTYKEYVIPDDSYPCGNLGVCQNKHCVGSKPLNLDTVCKEKTLNAGSKLYHEDQCKVLKCQVINDGVVQFYTYKEYVIPDDSYPCGNLGKCVKGECVGSDAAGISQGISLSAGTLGSKDRLSLDLNKECKRKTGKPHAEFNFGIPVREQCQVLHCRIEQNNKQNKDKRVQVFNMERYSEYNPLDGSYPCGKTNGTGGTCKNLVCIEP